MYLTYEWKEEGKVVLMIVCSKRYYSIVLLNCIVRSTTAELNHIEAGRTGRSREKIMSQLRTGTKS